jgi:hypothetical protein
VTRATAGSAGRWWDRPGAGLLLVVALLTAGTAAALATAPDAAVVGAVESGPGRQVSVARAAAACPDPVVDEGTATRVALAGSGPVGPTAGSARRPGTATLSRLRGSALASFVAPGSAAVDAAPGAGPLLARGSAGSAPGLAVSQTTRSTEATMRGLAGTRCVPPGTDFWFVGSGAVVGQRGRVYLTNPEPTPAVVDVTLYGPDGPIDAPDGRGVSVAGGEQEVRLLDALSPGTTRFAVHVRARQGRVSAAVRDQQVDGLTPLGADWVPAASAPARQVSVPGVPGEGGERLLQVVAPGDSDAIVRLRLVGEAGPFAPTGLDVLEVPAGSVAEVDLAPSTSGEPVTVELDADAPVTAGVLSRTVPAPASLSELAYAAASAPLTPDTPGVVPEVRQGELLTNRLWLTAPEAGAVTVVLTPLPPSSGTATEVTVPAGSQLPVDLATVSTAESFALSVVPTSGRLLAVLQVDEVEPRGVMLTSSPVPPGLFAVPVPRVVADLSTGLRGGG